MLPVTQFITSSFLASVCTKIIFSCIFHVFGSSVFFLRLTCRIRLGPKAAFKRQLLLAFAIRVVLFSVRHFGFLLSVRFQLSPCVFLQVAGDGVLEIVSLSTVLQL